MIQKQILEPLKRPKALDAVSDSTAAPPAEEKTPNGAEDPLAPSPPKRRNAPPPTNDGVEAQPQKRPPPPALDVNSPHSSSSEGNADAPAPLPLRPRPLGGRRTLRNAELNDRLNPPGPGDQAPADVETPVQPGDAGPLPPRVARPRVKPPGICPQGLSSGHKAPICPLLKSWCPIAEDQVSMDCSQGVEGNKSALLATMRDVLLKDHTTLISDFALRNIHDAVVNVAKLKLPGVVVECGVWKGGSSIYARAAMDIVGLESRQNYLADSYCGLPASDSTKFSDTADLVPWHTMGWLRVSLQDVKKNFERMCVSRKNSRFVKGFFQDTLPPVVKQFKESNVTISALRIDGDIYESTADVLYNLYELVDIGGYIIIDDWVWEALQYHAKIAVIDFMDHHGLHRDHFMERVDDTVAFFVKRRHIEVKHELYDVGDKARVRSQKRKRWGEAEYRKLRLAWEAKHDAERYSPHSQERRAVSQRMSELEAYLPPQVRKPLWVNGFWELPVSRPQHTRSLEAFGSYYFSYFPFPSETCSPDASGGRGCMLCKPVLEEDAEKPAVRFCKYASKPRL